MVTFFNPSYARVERNSNTLDPSDSTKQFLETMKIRVLLVIRRNICRRVRNIPDTYISPTGEAYFKKTRLPGKFAFRKDRFIVEPLPDRR